jgi:hypothetical protein
VITLFKHAIPPGAAIQHEYESTPFGGLKWTGEEIIVAYLKVFWHSPEVT